MSFICKNIFLLINFLILVKLFSIISHFLNYFYFASFTKNNLNDESNHLF